MLSSEHPTRTRTSFLQDDLKSKIATTDRIPTDKEMSYSQLCTFSLICRVSSSFSVIRPIDLITECYVVLKPKESYYERSRMYIDIGVEQISAYVTAEQISDVLTFIKVQNYTTFFGRGSTRIRSEELSTRSQIGVANIESC